MRNKVYIVIAGVNGAGKSTFYNSHLDPGDFFEFCDADTFQHMHRVNTDEILREFGSWQNKRDELRAGRIAVNTIRQCFSEGLSFCQETTLCGHSILKNIATAKENGYKIGLIYIGIDGVDLAKARVMKRVASGGHGVPEEAIERRYWESLKNLNLVIGQCDKVLFYDNTDRFQSVAVYSQRGLLMTYNSSRVPVWFKDHIDFSALKVYKEAPSHDTFTRTNHSSHDEH